MIVVGTDTETTGLDPIEDRIIEISLSVWRYRILTPPEKLKGYTWRVWTDKPIGAKAAAVHGITAPMLAGAPKWAEVGPKVHKILSIADVLVGHNLYGFDSQFLAAELGRIGLVLPPLTQVDTMIDGRWATPMGKAPNLGELCFATDTPYDKETAHAADYDTDVMMDAFWKGVDWGFFQLPSVAEAVAA